MPTAITPQSTRVFIDRIAKVNFIKHSPRDWLSGRIPTHHHPRQSLMASTLHLLQVSKVSENRERLMKLK
jgi:hypothetical protein